MDSGRMEVVPNGAGHLDTVRALHQTVVSLRTALEVSKNELKELKEKYEQHSHCLEYADVIEKLTLENHILRRRIIDTDFEKDQNIKLEVTYSPRSPNIDYPSEVVLDSGKTTGKDTEPDENSNFCSADKLNEIPEISEASEVNVSAEFQSDPQHTEAEENSQLVSSKEEDLKKEDHLPSFKTHLELLSKFDVRIKVRTLKDGVPSSGTSDSDSSFDKKDTFEFEEHREHFDNQEDSKGNKVNVKATENVKMAMANDGDKNKADKFGVQVRITSEENLVVKEHVERNRRKDTLNLDVDDLSLRSLSEGDNSVFSEGITPIEPTLTEDKQEEASGNESEEVDDIELIFTTDESKDMSNLQEDLVSIRESEHWAPNSSSTHSTPVLIKFHTLDPDFQPGTEGENQENTTRPIPESALKIKRVSLPNDKEIRRVAFNAKESLDLPGRGILKSCDNRSDNLLYKKSPNTSSRRLDSIDSLTCEYNRGLSFDNTKSSSFELGSSMDILHRDESMDNFLKTGHLGHRFSVFAERDISKCGTSEDDLALSLHVRRNTCPNPFQYRVPPYRGVSRPPGPFRVPLPEPRRDSCRVPTRDVTRRENAVQTDVSALPNRWSSDGYLAHKQLPICGVSPPTLPQRCRNVSRPRPVRDVRVAPRCDDTRRVLLSDIGFTSMVPELSRSADPVWALAKKQSEETINSSTSKYISRGSSFRSPCPSSEWTPRSIMPPPRGEYRLWRSSLPDVRQDDTDDLLAEADSFVRRSIDNLQDITYDDKSSAVLGQPYIPASPKHLRLGHAVKVITPHGRIAVGRVRYVGLAGGTAQSSSVMVGVELPVTSHTPHNDGTHAGRRYFLTQHNTTALFLPFTKVVMAWAN